MLSISNLNSNQTTPFCIKVTALHFDARGLKGPGPSQSIALAMLYHQSQPLMVKWQSSDFTRQNVLYIPVQQHLLWLLLYSNKFITLGLVHVGNLMVLVLLTHL
jgi:hypothetical protein